MVAPSHINQVIKDMSEQRVRALINAYICGIYASIITTIAMEYKCEIMVLFVTLL